VASCPNGDTAEGFVSLILMDWRNVASTCASLGVGILAMRGSADENSQTEPGSGPLVPACYRRQHTSCSPHVQSASPNLRGKGR